MYHLGLFRLQVVASFRAQHPEAPKNWCSNFVKQSAVHTASGWTITADVLAAHGELLHSAIDLLHGEG